MDGGIILNVGVITDLYVMYIATNYCIEPNRAVLAHFHLSDYDCIIR
jgi:hypothetical protein